MEFLTNPLNLVIFFPFLAGLASAGCERLPCALLRQIKNLLPRASLCYRYPDLIPMEEAYTP